MNTAVLVIGTLALAFIWPAVVFGVTRRVRRGTVTPQVGALAFGAVSAAPPFLFLVSRGGSEAGSALTQAVILGVLTIAGAWIIFRRIYGQDKAN